MAYLQLAQLGDEFRFFNVEFFELCGEHMIGEIEAAVFVIIIYLLVLGVLHLRLRIELSLWSLVLLRFALLKGLAHLNYFIIISISI